MNNQLGRFKQNDIMPPKRRFQESFCFLNFMQYLKKTVLHGWHFVGDNSISIWERGFFLIAISAALLATGHFIVYSYATWVSTPVIIGINPYPTLISDLPFPSVTICNMNQVMHSKVSHFSKNSFEAAMIDIVCFNNEFESFDEVPDNYKYNNLSLIEFSAEHGQACESMFINCELNSEVRNCSDIFRDSLADEGLCCVFNVLHPSFRSNGKYSFIRDFAYTDGAVPVDWSPEFGYQKNLPKQFYPRKASGIGVSMGLSVILDVKHDEYFCSSANVFGFKVGINNPTETPRVKENGLIVAAGYETRFSIDTQRSIAALDVRGVPSMSRHCYFADEGDLVHYKYYTRHNCENECQAQYILNNCECIPFNLPRIYSNATLCGAPQILCVSRAQNAWLRAKDLPCRVKCLDSCFDYSYLATSYTTPLVQGNYTVQSESVLGNMSREYIRENIVVLHFFYRDFVFHGSTRNVYIGFTEFLSNIGGIMSLFLGFSFISLAEMFYFSCLRPYFWWLNRRRIVDRNSGITIKEEMNASPVWISKELMYLRREPAWVDKTTWSKWNYRKFKNDLLKQQARHIYGKRNIIKVMGKQQESPDAIRS